MMESDGESEGQFLVEQRTTQQQQSQLPQQQSMTNLAVSRSPRKARPQLSTDTTGLLKGINFVLYKDSTDKALLNEINELTRVNNELEDRICDLDQGLRLENIELYN